MPSTENSKVLSFVSLRNMIMSFRSASGAFFARMRKSFSPLLNTASYSPSPLRMGGSFHRLEYDSYHRILLSITWLKRPRGTLAGWLLFGTQVYHGLRRGIEIE